MRETPGSRDDAAGWADDGCPDAIRAALRRPVDLGGDARARLAAALAAEDRPRPAPRGVAAHLATAARWLVRPLRLPLPPLAMGGAAAALLLCGVLAGRQLAPDAPSSRARATVSARVAAAGSAAADSVRVVRFVLVAPTAARVALVGDFNAWDADRTPMRPTGDAGVWSVELPVSEGRHVYAFVVDGTRWVADPTAPLAPEDGFGSRNSVIVVGGET